MQARRSKLFTKLSSTFLRKWCKFEYSIDSSRYFKVLLESFIKTIRIANYGNRRARVFLLSRRVEFIKSTRKVIEEWRALCFASLISDERLVMLVSLVKLFDSLGINVRRPVGAQKTAA
jgi:hypothetical protein